ncbi:MAG: DUF6443 domain-containing protein, partial [Muribaculum sp.]|nr:DUF6443 domain-containing protein [Muribaculum sp.]
MKQIPLALKPVILLLSSVFCLNAYGQTTGNDVDGTTANDSLRMEQTRAVDSSFFDGIIPVSPQASALARYAEYPVSHATGIPDITILLYEIRMGDFTLPITISYHSSGARPDEIHTTVGQGWVLNAGGAVTRTILGGPDRESESESTHTYYDEWQVRTLINNISQNRGNGHLTRLLNTKDPLDSESDRYTFNAGGLHTGTFRYSYIDNENVMLDRSPYIVEPHGYGDSSYFMLYCPDNTAYKFSVQEKSGPAEDCDDNIPTTAWYVSDIYTPYGDIKIKYQLIYERFYYERGGATVYRAGYYPKSEWVIQNTSKKVWYEYDIKSTTGSPVKMYFRQMHVSEIEWNGNSIEFNYERRDDTEFNMRLVSMVVKSSEGEIVKTVTFGNDQTWHPHGNRPRRMLRTLADSEAGTYTFTYDESADIPTGLSSGNPGTYTDSWGYYNGSTLGKPLSEGVAAWLSVIPDGETHNGIKGRDRTPSLRHARLGVLSGIIFPTGGKLTYEYELNELDGERLGGLRVASVTLDDGGDKTVTTYKYDRGLFNQMHPDSLCTYTSYLFFDFREVGTSHIRPYRTAVDTPIMSSIRPQCPVMYLSVTETRSDGSRTEYDYTPVEPAIDRNRTDWHHPLTFPEATIDSWVPTPLLKTRTDYDKDGVATSRETNTYRISDTQRFNTGIRLVSVIDRFRHVSDSGSDDYVEHDDEFAEGMGQESLLAVTTSARQVAAVLESTLSEDLTTGVSSLTTYSYDPGYRTTSPVSETVVNSDGTSHTKEYEYPFHRTGGIFDDMAGDVTYCGWPVSVTHKVNGKIIQKSETEYEWINYYVQATASRSWSMPTTDTSSPVPSVLPERERITSFNDFSRPLSIKVNGTDETTFTWNDTGDLLLSSTAPGGLTTRYAHRPLFGLDTVTSPNGHFVRYGYDDSGRLSHVQDNLGGTETYNYGIVNHPGVGTEEEGNSVTSRRYLTRDGSVRIIDRQFYDGLGRPSVLAKAGMNTSRIYLYSATTYDKLGRELRSIMPGVGDTEIERKTATEVLSSATSTYDDSNAYSETTYDGLDRPVRVTTPGQAWNDAKKWKTTEYVGNAANSVRCYHAPMTSLSLVEDGYYAASTLQGVRSIDEDGNEMTVYTDRLGRKVLERRGPESGKGQNDTY